MQQDGYASDASKTGRPAAAVHACCTQCHTVPHPSHGAGNPENGLRHFDNILWSWLTIFQCITMTDWVFVMYNTQVGVRTSIVQLCGTEQAT